ncbi:MAG TPA: hypothetical protein PKD12_15610 [Nitrospira sp.]|nr:hypothetical protein [Nitrospira sp.]
MEFPLPEEKKKVVHEYLDQFSFTKANYEFSYQYWAKGGRGWGRTFATGGTYTMKALMWYHHHHQPESQEWRPPIIMNALCKAAGLTH